MSKKQQDHATKGNRITGKKASAAAKMDFYEFLLFDPLYREMKDKAKILYSFLRKKTETWEYLTKQFEAGEEGFTKSYRDDNGEIYVIADNSELSVILQCHPNRVKDQKDELKDYGLLDEIEQYKDGKKTASHLYILTPKEEQLTEKWMYIEEIKSLREKTKQENIEKAEKHKAKKAEAKAAKSVEKSSDDEVSNSNSQNVSYARSESNSQNVSYSNQQNVSYSNSQNVSKNLSKGFKDSFKLFKDSFNLSISESALINALKNTLFDRIDRLIEYKINVSDIEKHFNAVKETYWVSEYDYVLACLLDQMSERPKTFGAVMNNWLKRNRTEFSNIPPKQNGDRKPIRTELLPDWFDKDEIKQDSPETKTFEEMTLAELKIQQERLKSLMSKHPGNKSFSQNLEVVNDLIEKNEIKEHKKAEIKEMLAEIG